MHLRDGSELKRGVFFPGGISLFLFGKKLLGISKRIDAFTIKAEQASGKNGENTNILGNQKLNCGGDDYERVSLTFRHLLDTRRMLSSGSKPDLETATETRTETVATACPEQKGRMGGWVTRALATE